MRAGVSRVIVDLATASGATTRRILRHVAAGAGAAGAGHEFGGQRQLHRRFFRAQRQRCRQAVAALLRAEPVRSFAAAAPGFREVLREQLGDRLLPFALRRAPAVSEALAEGMTVMDYAPNSTVAEDFGSLAGWVKSQSAPASSSLSRRALE